MGELASDFSAGEGMTADRFDLRRFVAAQEAVFAAVQAELAAGRKLTHWMWFVFPQLAGLGTSEMARRYAISGRQEATAYLAHPLLGRRLRESAALVNAVKGRRAVEIFGPVDAMKLLSSMTLFAEVDGYASVFGEVLGKYFGGQYDRRTLALLGPA